MKKMFLLSLFTAMIGIGISSTNAHPNLQLGKSELLGAWQVTTEKETAVLLITEQYFSYTRFNVKEKSFLYTYGGVWKSKGGEEVEIKFEFHTNEKELVGQTFTVRAAFKEGKLQTEENGEMVNWTRVDQGEGSLAGDWRISGREQNGKMNVIQLGARKTIKILSGTRFQWIAINTETGEFFGTGGGAYTFKEGVYTERIEFFSRDSSRVGASLQFEGKVEGEQWLHSGKSSKGDPIKEIWTRQST